MRPTVGHAVSLSCELSTIIHTVRIAASIPIRSEDPINPLLLCTLFFSQGLFYDFFSFRRRIGVLNDLFSTADSQLLFLSPLIIAENEILPRHQLFECSLSCMSVLRIHLCNLNLLPTSVRRCHINGK